MPKPTRNKSPKAQFFHGAPDEVCGRAFALPFDISLSGDFLDWGPEYTAKIRLPETIAKPLSLADRVPAKPVARIVNRRPCLDARELDRLCSDPAALRKFLAEKQKQIEAFAPKRKSRFNPSSI